MPSDTDEQQAGLTHERQRSMREALLRIIEPVKAEVAEIDARLVVLDAERQELLSARRDALAVIRAADPSERKTYKPKAKATSNGSAGGLNNDTRETLMAFFDGHGDEFGDGLNARVLDEHPDLRLNKSTIGRALNILADEGVLRLDRIGYLGDNKNGREGRIYKLTNAGGE